jgi:hypothetical protein
MSALVHPMAPEAEPTQAPASCAPGSSTRLTKRRGPSIGDEATDEARAATEQASKLGLVADETQMNNGTTQLDSEDVAWGAAGWVPSGQTAAAPAPDVSSRQSSRQSPRQMTRQMTTSIGKKTAQAANRLGNTMAAAHGVQAKDLSKLSAHTAKLALQAGSLGSKNNAHAMRLVRACQRRDFRIALKHLIDVPRHSARSMLVFYVLHATYFASLYNLYASSSISAGVGTDASGQSYDKPNHMLVSMTLLQEGDGLSRAQRNGCIVEIVCTVIFTFELAARLIIGSLDWVALLRSSTFCGARVCRIEPHCGRERTPTPQGGTRYHGQGVSYDGSPSV